MKKFLMQMLVLPTTLILLTLPGSAGQLDDYYLQQYAVTVGNELQKAVLLLQEESSGRPHCGTPVKHGLQRDWNQLESTTQKMLAKQVAAPVLSGEKTLLSISGRFLIHYTTSGADAVPSLAWVQTVAQTFDDVANAYTALGWNRAPTVSGAPYDVYLRDLANDSIYGQTTSTQAIPSTGYANAIASFIEIDNDFTDSLFVNQTGGPYTALQSLQITAAHEYHHAIQYGYNLFFDIWYAEATSTWQEDELYDSVNQLYSYLYQPHTNRKVASWFYFSYSSHSLDTFIIPDKTYQNLTFGHGYGRWIFNRYLSDEHDTSIIRNAWEKLATLNSPGNNTDIPMVPVLENILSATTFSSSLGTDYTGFVKRIYLRDWPAGPPHAGDLSLIPFFSPLATYSSYPVNVSPITLPHYSFEFYRFSPSPATPTSFNIFVQKTSGIVTAVFKNVGGIISEVPLAAGSSTYTINGFTASSPTSASTSRVC